MKTFVLLALLVSAIAEEKANIDNEQLRVTFNDDANNPRNIGGRPFALQKGGEKDNLKLEDGPRGEGLCFTGNDNYLYAGERRVTDNCWSDLEQCEEGFTLSVWIKPEGPNESENILSLGGGVQKPFGLKLGIRRKTLIVRAIGRQKLTKVDCEIPDDIETGEWMHVAIQQTVNNKGKKKPVYVYINGGDKCKGQDQVADLTEVTKLQIVVGADQDPETDKFYGHYHGCIDDLRFYHRGLSIPDIRDIYQEGKARVKDLLEILQNAENESSNTAPY